jgi:regulator of sirC expression with transglutaminase-like and TPR domain
VSDARPADEEDRGSVVNEALEAFAAEVRRADAELNLARAALLIAAGEYPGLAVDAWRSRLDEIAAGVIGSLERGAPPRVIAGTIRQRLFDDLGFHGNQDDYYDPRNSYLNDVLVRRTGIPITLATVFLEVGWRAGLDAAGVSYPGHFLVKYVDGGREWIVDPFHGGHELPAEDFRAHLGRSGTAPDNVVDYYLSAVTRRQILARMLANLKAIYAERRDHTRTLRIQEYLLALTPWSMPDIRDRGVLRARTGDITGALADLETYVSHGEASEDAGAVRNLIDHLRAGRPI